MPIKKSLLIVSIGTLALIAGCNQNPAATPPPAGANKDVASTPSPSPTSTPTPSPSTPSGKIKNLCQLLTPAEVSEILGYSVKVGDLPMPNGETVTGCHYESTDTDKGYGVTMIANYDNPSVPAKSAYDSAVSELKSSLDPASTKFEDVTGVGDSAALSSSGFMGTLLAVKGNVWISGSMAGSDASRNDTLKKVVAAALEKL